jgi:hypothetical protein
VRFLLLMRCYHWRKLLLFPLLPMPRAVRAPYRSYRRSPIGYLRYDTTMKGRFRTTYLHGSRIEKKRWLSRGTGRFDTVDTVIPIAMRFASYPHPAVSPKYRFDTGVSLPKGAQLMDLRGPLGAATVLAGRLRDAALLVARSRYAFCLHAAEQYCICRPVSRFAQVRQRMQYEIMAPAS